MNGPSAAVHRVNRFDVCLVVPGSFQYRRSPVAHYLWEMEYSKVTSICG